LYPSCYVGRRVRSVMNEGHRPDQCQKDCPWSFPIVSGHLSSRMFWTGS
jgi:hypothetical protein